MRSIKHALTERFYTWQDAVDVAMADPEINFAGKEGQVYTPSAYEDEYDASEWTQPEGEAAKELKDSTPVDPIGAEAQQVKAEKETTR